MPGRQRVRAVVLAAVVAFAGAGCARDTAPDATLVDLTLSVGRDGSLQVQETIRLQIDRPIASFRRVSPAVGHDGISDVRATLDGAEVPAGNASTTVTSAANDHLDVTWTFRAMTGPHTFGLSYRALGAVHVSGIRGRVSWMAMPPDRSFDIRSMNVNLALPEGVVQIGDPWVMEAGWAVTREPLGMRASRSSIPAREGVHVGAEFTVDTLKLPEPVWQYHEERAEEFKPAFLSGGGFLLVVAAGIVGMIRLRLAAIEAGPAREIERETTARGLRVTATVTIITGVIGWVVVRQTLGTYGPWPYFLPACTVLSGVIFLVDARRLRK
jgi:hypothetical protein